MAYDDLPVIDSASALEEYGVPQPAVRDKVRDRLHDLDRRWIAHSPFIVLSTSSPDGRCDASPKGDPPGFVKVLDEQTLVVPERAGNKRFDGYHNVIQNPHVGLLFLIPGRGDTLRVNGRARLVSDGPFFDDLLVKGHRPVMALLLEVEEVFYHCAKAFMRSQLWEPETWDPTVVPRHAVIAKELVRQESPLAELDAYYDVERYKAGLYPSAT